LSFFLVLSLCPLCLCGEPEDKVPPIDPDVLGGIEDRQPVRGADENGYEARAYNYVLVEARKFSPEAFARSARRDVTFAHLFEQPSDFRGQVIHVEGRLKRLRKFDAPRAAAAEGVPTIYEGWVFEEIYFSNPFCVIVTELPEGIRVGERLEQRVAFDGYFFKNYKYQAGDGKRLAPLLIGRTLLLREPAAAPESAWSFGNMFLPAFLILVLGTAVLVVTLTWWFRRGDSLVRARLAAAQRPTLPEPLPEEAAPAEEVGPARAVPPARGDRIQPLNGHS
jgi:hypothetical protein